jgi:hypothetical protein
MNYNKKQMQPLIDKYQINPETNKLFASVIEMFDGQPNYQIWAVKVVFSKVVSFNELLLIHDWSEKNQTMIKNLEKKNIVSYSTRNAILQLQQEMKGIDMLNTIKDVISHFNTEQRKMLSDSILPADITPLSAFKDAKINLWADILQKFNRLPSTRKNNFYTKASSVRDISELQQLITNCLEETYKWDKEDMLAYLENNAKDCDVVFNQGPYVIVHVPSFESSEKLCGRGRTQWCITMGENHFRDYVTPRGEMKNEQFFIFDFSRKETDCFAHIGFTLKRNGGIIYAQTCDNKEMINDFTSQSGEVLNIHTALEKIGVNPTKLVVMPKNKEFEWAIVSILEYVHKNPSNYAIALEKDNRLIVNVLSNNALNKLVNHTMICSDMFPVNDSNKAYVLFDLNLPYDDENAVVAMSYYKDSYGTFSLNNMTNLFGKNINGNKYLDSINILQDEYVNRETLEPGIMLHKLIDEGSEKEAIKLINKNRDNLDVNYEFNMRLPIFSAANNKMMDLFEVIVNHPSFSLSHEDGFGDSILQALLFIYGSNDTNPSKEDEERIEKMISCIIENNRLDFNGKDINDDTAINITCEYPTMAWVTERLVRNKAVDVNSKNGSGLSPLANAIKNKNFKAIEALGKRPDLIVGKDETKLAESNGINLSKFIKPTESVFLEKDTLEEAERLLEFAMSGTL